jgi:protoporphyrinogen oxidase
MSQVAEHWRGAHGAHGAHGAGGARDLRPRVVVIGGGFTGLAAAFELARGGTRVTVLEADQELGGLAGSFTVDADGSRAHPARLEKFYHHWFTGDTDVVDLARALGVADRVERRATQTGMYYARSIHRLSNPLDLMRFSPLRVADRIRLGQLALRARRVKDWAALDGMTAQEWLLRLGGPEVYRVVWAPLLEGKFGSYARDVSAVWMWNKLKLRGGSRSRGGGESLAYFRGGFAALAERLADEVCRLGGAVRVGTPATGLVLRDGHVVGVETDAGRLRADAVVATPALPIVAELVEPHAPAEYVAQLRRIEYLANVCLVLELDRPLSSTYWLNVNDPGFPFVGVIEHTNFEPAAAYGGRHIVYVSKYLATSAPLYQMADADVVAFALPHLARMFPKFDPSWVAAAHVWRARYAQPVVVRNYSALIPPMETPIAGLYLSTMAQIYPEDRGTSYAIRDGRRVGRVVAAAVSTRSAE